MSQLPNIIFTDPNYNYPGAESKKEHTPIKQLSLIRSIDEITNEYLSLFGHVSSVLECSESSLRNSNKQIKESPKKSNIGMKIKQRLESKSKNRYQPLLTFLQQCQTSKIVVEPHNQQSLSQQKLFLNQSNYISSHGQEKVQQILIQKIQQKSKLNNFEDSKKKGQENKQTRQHTSGSSKNSSAYSYNNISAKTYYSQAQSVVEQFCIQTQSPIQKLNSLCQSDSPSVKEFKLDRVNDQRQVKQVYDGFFKLKQVQCDLNINNIRLAQSGVWETPHQENKNNYSVCFSCQENRKLTPLEYAMRQLQKLKENVDQLEKATNSLIVTKILSVQSSVILPSPINKQNIQLRKSCSFLENLQQNYRQVFDIHPQSSKQQSLLIEQDHSKHFNPCKNLNYISEQLGFQNKRIIYRQPYQMQRNILQQVQINENIQGFNTGSGQITKYERINKINSKQNKQNDLSYLK